MQIFEQILTAAVVLASMMALLWVLRRRGLARFRFGPRGTASRRNMEVLERTPLTAQHSLHLVRVGERLLLVAVSPSGCERIESFEASAFAAEPPVSARGLR